jgi:hypothetical protein
MMASKRNVESDTISHSTRHPLRDTRHPQGQRRPRFPFFLPNNVKEQTSKQNHARLEPGITNRAKPAQPQKEAKPPENRPKGAGADEQPSTPKPFRRQSGKRAIFTHFRILS